MPSFTPTNVLSAPSEGEGSISLSSHSPSATGSKPTAPHVTPTTTTPAPHERVLNCLIKADDNKKLPNSSSGGVTMMDTVPFLNLTDDDLSPIPVYHHSAISYNDLRPMRQPQNQQWEISQHGTTDTDVDTTFYTPSDPCVPGLVTKSSRLPSPMCRSRSQTEGLGSSSSMASRKTRIISADTIAGSASEVSLTGVPNPPSPQPGQTAADHSSGHFSASGFGHVRTPASSLGYEQSGPIYGITRHEAPGSITTSSTSFARPKFTINAANDPNLTPVNSSNDLISTYSFSPGSVEPETCGSDHSPKQHRRKRLERNRESARLSRRRRKQYLEVLEERVSSLSEAMDSGRRTHVSQAVSCIKSRRSERLLIAKNDLAAHDSSKDNNLLNTNETMRKLEQHLHAISTIHSRTSDELRITAEFQKEQLKSLLISPHMRFVLWMTVQNESFFRGGRAASERLSAARIGEKMLSVGNDRVVPCTGMWPLFCHEVGLSYDQEEKVRAYQRKMLADKHVWLHRHTTRALGASIQSSFRSVNGLSEMVRRREGSILGVLTVDQRLRFLSWAKSKTGKISSILGRLTIPSSPDVPGFNLDESLQPAPAHHNTANLYLVDKFLQTVQQMLPSVSSLVDSTDVKKLSRRPSFESLGSRMSASSKDLSGSSSSSCPLKKQSSSAEDRRPDSPPTPCASPGRPLSMDAALVSPESAQAAAVSFVISALGPMGRAVQPPWLHPNQCVPPTLTCDRYTLGSEVSSCVRPIDHASLRQPDNTGQRGYITTLPSPTDNRQMVSDHRREISLLNSPLPSTNEDIFMNIATEEEDLPSQTDEFLQELADGAWAIGGIDIDMNV